MSLVPLPYEELLQRLINLPMANQDAWEETFALLHEAEEIGIHAIIAFGRDLSSRDVMIRFNEMLLRLDWQEEASRKRVIYALIQNLIYEESLRGRSLALHILQIMLKRYPDRNLQRQLLGLLFDEDVYMRQSAISMFEELADEQAVPYLVILMDDLDSGISYLSRRALGRINSPSAQFALYEWERRDGNP